MKLFAWKIAERRPAMKPDIKKDESKPLVSLTPF